LSKEANINNSLDKGQTIMVDIPRLVLNSGLQFLRSPAGAVDWRQVAKNAANVGDAQLWPHADKKRLLPTYSGFVDAAMPQIIEVTGLQAPRARQIRVFDRYDWIKTNINAFADQFAPLEQALMTREGDSLISRGVYKSNQVISTVGFSLLLGYLAKKVLGQYDPSLFGREIVSGQIYFVEPNIEIVERQLSFARNDFRRWIAIHEVTHAVVFESVPWLKGHVNQLLKRYLEATNEGLASDGVQARTRAVASYYIERGQFSLLHAALSLEQIDLLNQIQALMSVIEGYSDFVMDRIGKELFATYDHMKRAFDLRRRNKSGRERFFERATGLGMKMEQYVLGEQFVSHVETSQGIDFVNRVWRSQSDIPTLDELTHPEKWIVRQKSTT
jgi:coenzyme F420 biosynthesis associated uncharacterized protein